jgi:arylsulfatase A-like enzyme
VWAAALLLCGGATAQEAAQNILLLILDDVGTELVGVYGEGEDPAPTPNIDSLADGGVLFRNAYSSPLCSPTRATILTGRYGFRNVIGPGNRLVRRDVPNLPRLLPAAYETRRAAIGKWHLGGNRWNEDVRHPVDFAGFDFYEGQPGNFRQPEDNYYEWYKITAEAEREGQYLEEHVSCSWERRGGGRDVSCYITSVTIDDVIERIDAYGNEPWFLWVGLHAVHYPIDMAPPKRLLRHRYDYTKESEMRRAHLEAADTEIGRLLKVIRRTDTTVIIVGDNGTDNGCKRTVRECGIRVPLIIHRAGAPGGYRESHGLVNTTDLFETIVELATGEAASGDADSPDSESLVPYLDDPTLPTLHRASTDGPYVYSERFARVDAVDKARALRGDGAALRAQGNSNDWDQDYKLVYERMGSHPGEYRLEEQLYALGNEPVPHESANLLYDGDGDTVPDVELSDGARAARDDLRAAMKLLQDRDGDGVDYRLDNCLDVENAAPEHCGGDPNGTNAIACNCDVDWDGIGNRCDCDFNNDGSCDDLDASILSFGIDPPHGTEPNPSADMNCDGSIDEDDEALFESMLPAGAPGASGLWCADPLGSTLPCTPTGP